MSFGATWLSDRQAGLDCAYTQFRSRLRPAIFSAVPDDRPVPGFLDSWMFDGVAMPAACPPGFNVRAARVGVRYNGFYLFQTTGCAGRIHDRGTATPSLVSLNR
jgi:hypothetical protein